MLLVDCGNCARYRGRQLSPVELIDAYLERIGKIDPRLNSYVTVFSKDARADALRAEAAFARGEFRGSLHGVPLALKDLFDLAGKPTGANTRVLEGRIPEANALLVDRLREEGADISRQAPAS